MTSRYSCDSILSILPLTMSQGVNAMVSLIREATALRRRIRSAADFVDGTIPYEISNQESLTTMPGISCIIDAVVGDRESLGHAMRCACPREGCGLAEKNGRKNQYSADASGVATISCYCPDHGLPFGYDVQSG
jgi:hypothetical protein